MLLKVSLYVPAPLIVKLSQRYGSSVSHTVAFVVSRKIGHTCRFMVSIESQPWMLLNVSLYVPAPLRLRLSHAKGSSVSHTSISTVSRIIGHTCKFTVSIESQPWILLSVSL